MYVLFKEYASGDVEKIGLLKNIGELKKVLREKGKKNRGVMWLVRIEKPIILLKYENGIKNLGDYSKVYWFSEIEKILKILKESIGDDVFHNMGGS